MASANSFHLTFGVFHAFFMASQKLLGFSIPTLIVLGILGVGIVAPQALSGIPVLGGIFNGGNGGQVALDAPINVNLINGLSGATIDGEGIEIYKPGAATALETWDIDSDTASDSSLQYKSGDVYFFVVCEGTAAQVTGVGCEGTDGGVREFGADDSVKGVTVTIPFASNTQQTQHNIVVSISLTFDDGTGEDISWVVVSGTESLTDNDGSTTDNDYSGNGGVGVAAETEEFTATQIHQVTITNTNDNRGFERAFTMQDSGNTIGLRLIVQLRNENGTGTARITDIPSLFATGGASPTNWYDLGDASDCIIREVVGTVIKQNGVCSQSFTIEHGTYTDASAFTQVTVYLVQYLDVGYFGRTGTANPEAFLDAATTDCYFDFFITDA